MLICPGRMCCLWDASQYVVSEIYIHFNANISTCYCLVFWVMWTIESLMQMSRKKNSGVETLWKQFWLCCTEDCTWPSHRLDVYKSLVSWRICHSETNLVFWHCFKLQHSYNTVKCCWRLSENWIPKFLVQIFCWKSFQFLILSELSGVWTQATGSLNGFLEFTVQHPWHLILNTW